MEFSSRGIERDSARAEAGVIRDFVADEQRGGGLGELVERPGPRMEIDLFGVVKGADDVVELPERKPRARCGQAPIEFGQGAIAELSSLAPGGELLADQVPDVACLLAVAVGGL